MKQVLYIKETTKGINWSALGTVSVKTSRDFMNNLSEAIGFVKNLNKDYKGGKNE